MKLNQQKTLKKSIFATAGTAIALSFSLSAGSANAISLNLGNPYDENSDEWKSLSTQESFKYLFIGNGGLNDVGNKPGVGHAVNVSSGYELGANKAPTPSTSDFGQNTGGPGLFGNVPDLPDNAATVESNIGGHGNIAITSEDGAFNLQDVGVYADPDIGIQCARDNIEECNDGTSNSFFNDGNQFPNTVDTSDYRNSQGVNPNDADQTTRIDPDGEQSQNTGVTAGVDLTDLKNEVFEGGDSISDVLPGIQRTGTLDLRDNGGKITDGVDVEGDLVQTDAKKGKEFDPTTGTSSDYEIVEGGTFTINLESGLNIIDIITGSDDFLIENSNLVIDGAEDSYAIFRIQGNNNMNVSNSNILAGNGGIGLNNILFFTDQQQNDQHFNFSNTVINGAAFWTTGQKGGEINVDNGQGCAQFVADKITMNDIRWNHCGFNLTQADIDNTIQPEIPKLPEPSAIVGLLAVVGAGTLLKRQKQ